MELVVYYLPYDLRSCSFQLQLVKKSTNFSKYFLFHLLNWKGAPQCQLYTFHFVQYTGIFVIRVICIY